MYVAKVRNASATMVGRHKEMSVLWAMAIAAADREDETVDIYRDGINVKVVFPGDELPWWYAQASEATS